MQSVREVKPLPGWLLFLTILCIFAVSLLAQKTTVYEVKKGTAVAPYGDRLVVQ